LKNIQPIIERLSETSESDEIERREENSSIESSELEERSEGSSDNDSVKEAPSMRINLNNECLIRKYKNLYIEIINTQRQEMFINIDIEDKLIPKIELWNRNFSS